MDPSKPGGPPKPFDAPGRPFTPRPAKKSLGQHFLVDGNVTARIVRTAAVAPGDRVLEIGPGRGHLTRALVEAGAFVTAVETDHELARLLKESFAPSAPVEVVDADALAAPFGSLVPGPVKCVSNLPYNISGPMLFKFFKERHSFTLIVLMLQKEVAARVASPPGSREYGVLSVFLQTYFSAKVAFNVPPSCFRPRPKVDSSVIVLTPLDTPAASVEDEDAFVRVVKGAFSMRRKTVANALKSVCTDSARILRALETSGVEPTRRPETLLPADFAAVAALLSR